MLLSRVLPVDEWEKIANREPFASTGLPDPSHWLIVVVERDGAVIASCALFDSVHWDAFEINGEARKNPAVFGALLNGALNVLQQQGVRGVHITIPDGQPELESIGQRLGFVKANGQLYILAVPPKE